MAGGGINLATAYVQLIPSLKGAKASIAKELSGVDTSSAGKSMGSKLAGGLGSAIKGMNIGSHLKGALASAGSAVASAAKDLGSKFASGFKATAAAAAAGIGTTLFSSISSYADYEQLKGGVEKLYSNGSGDASAKVMENAANAYATVGLSANEYMATATQFSSSLVSALGGDVDRAAEQTQKAMEIMADNVNVFGSDYGAVSDAVKGFAKQNYTMLDNLKLGYGGNESEMKRLLADATALSGIEYDIDNLSDVIDAIGVIQDEMGITGTTAKEAASTISGSLTMAKAAFSNFITGLADDNADIGELTKNLVTSVSTFLGNVVPRVKTVLSNIVGVIRDSLPAIRDWIKNELPAILSDFLTIFSDLAGSAAELIPGIVEAVASAAPMLVATVASVVNTLVQSMAEQLPAILAAVQESLPLIITTVVDFLTASVPVMVEMGVQLLVSLVSGIAQVIDGISAAMPEIVSSICETLLAHMDEIVHAGVDLLCAIVKNIGQVVQTILPYMPQIVVEMATAFISCIPQLIDVGAQLIGGILTGIVQAIPNLIQAAIDAAGQMISGIKSFLGIASPSKKARKEIGQMVPQGEALGIRDAMGEPIAAMREMNEGVMAAGVSPMKRAVERSGIYKTSHVEGTSGGNVYNVYINNARVNDGEAINARVGAFLLDLDRLGVV